MFDSHTHIYVDEFSLDIDEVIKRAKENNVNYFLLPSDTLIESKKAIDLASKHENMFVAIGIHPSEIDTVTNIDETINELKKLYFNHQNLIKAIGEIGLDYHYDKDVNIKNRQKEIFIRQIELANELNLPVVIHSRDAAEDSLKIVKEHKINNGFVFHCFSYSVEIMNEILKLGGYIGLDGPVTYINSKVSKEVAKKIPLDRLLLETDAPYLSPVPFRGKRNEPKNLIYILREIAFLREMDEAELDKISEENGKRFFRI